MYHLEGDYLVDSHEDRSDPLYFSYSYDHGYNAILPAGLNYSINTMRLGEKFRFYIPSYQAYSGYSNEDFFDEYRSEEHTSELQSRGHLVWRILLQNKFDK